MQDATKTWHNVRPATYGNWDVEWRRFYSRGLLGTSTTPCVPFSVLELAINKQGQLLSFNVQVGYVKRPPVKTSTSWRASKEIASGHVKWLLRSDECYTNSSFSIHVLKSPAVCRFESTSYVAVPLTVRHQRLRLNKARGHTIVGLGADESRFNVQFADGRLRIWRRTGESMDENNIVERDRYGDGIVMIWKGILVYHSGKTELVTVNGLLNARRYCDEIIIPGVIAVLQRGRAYIMQQDNSRCHVARHTMFSPFTVEQQLDTRLASACD